MKRLVSSMSGGQKGFTLIELLVVIAILGVIAAVVALNVAGFFGRGTLQAANTELHQAQTAIIAAMADAQSNELIDPATNSTLAVDVLWGGETGLVVVKGTDGIHYDASTYVYGPFRASYRVSHESGGITFGYSDPADTTNCLVDNPWGSGIFWGVSDSWTDDTAKQAVE